MEIHSRNAAFQRLEALKRSRRKRNQLGLVYVEGVQPINAAMRSGVSIEHVFIDASRIPSTWAETVARSAANVDRISPVLMAELSEKSEPSELVALVERPQLDPSRLIVDAGSVWVLVDRPASHGNLGSIVRTCDAFGAATLLTTGHAVDLFDPATIRASVGTVFNVPVGHIEMPALRSLIASHADMNVYGTSAKAALPVDKAALQTPALIMLGNETRGLSKPLAALCDSMIGIEMSGLASSLNVGAAAAIIMHELRRQSTGR